MAGHRHRFAGTPRPASPHAEPPPPSRRRRRATRRASSESMATSGRRWRRIQRTELAASALTPCHVALTLCRRVTLTCPGLHWRPDLPRPDLPCCPVTQTPCPPDLFCSTMAPCIALPCSVLPCSAVRCFPRRPMLFRSPPSRRP